MGHKNIFYHLSLFLFFIIVIGCSEAKPKAFRSEDGRFSVMMPGTPEGGQSIINTAAGDITLYSYMVGNTDIAYLVGYADYPPSIINDDNIYDLLDGAKYGALNSVEGELIRETRIAYGNDPGIEMLFDAKKGSGLGHTVFIMSGNRLYQAMVLGSRKRFNNKTAQQFIDSFEIW